MNTENLQWQRAVPGELMSSNEVHIWRAFLNTIYFQSEELTGLLSPDELKRAEQFHFEKDQKRFIMTRGILRTILGHYLQRKPSEIRFEYTGYGKPVLSTKNGDNTVSFNLSHSDEIALLAVTRSCKIGIDVECIRHDVNIGQIAQRFFTCNEINSINRVDENKRSEKFFRYWTRKEAFLKAIGKGVSFPMDQCDVTLINGEVLSPVELLGDDQQSARWYVQDLFPGDGYAAAIAIEGCDWDLSCWHYSA